MLGETQRFAGIDDKQIIAHFHGLRKRRGHLPESPHIMTMQHKYFSSLLFETIGILMQDRYIDMQFAHWLYVQLHFDIFSQRTNNSSRYRPCQQSLYTILHFVFFGAYIIQCFIIWNYFGSLAGFQSACSFTFLKLC